MFAHTKLSLRTQMLLTAPLVLLLVAALAANAGFGVASKATAATVIVSATISADNHITDACGDDDETGPNEGALAFGSLSPGTATEETCTIEFGSANTDTNLQMSAASTNLGWSDFTATTAACSAMTTNQIGYRMIAGTATTAMNCTAGQHRQIPTGAATVCSEAIAGDATCDLAVGVNVGAASTGARNGTITFTSVAA